MLWRLNQSESSVHLAAEIEAGDAQNNQDNRRRFDGVHGFTEKGDAADGDERRADSAPDSVSHADV